MIPRKDAPNLAEAKYYLDAWGYDNSSLNSSHCKYKSLKREDNFNPTLAMTVGI
jgi:hypothetical protein